MILFGHDVSMKLIPCAYNGVEDTRPGDDYVNLYVRVTDKCNASCDFCEFRNNHSSKKFDFYKFYYVLHELKKKVRINKISFTGGEPTLEWELVNECLKTIKALDEKIYTVVNSNGLNIMKINFEYLNSYALSRHGFALQNDEIFKCSVRSDEQLSQLEQEIKDKIHISCNLQKGYIETPKDMFEFIQHYSRMGFHDFGFVTLMEVNDYCRTHKIDFRSLNFEDMKNTRRMCTFNDKEACFCANYVTYDDEGELNRWYARHYCDQSKSDSTLVFDLDYLKVGFNGKTILA